MRKCHLFATVWTSTYHVEQNMTKNGSEHWNGWFWKNACSIVQSVTWSYQMDEISRTLIYIYRNCNYLGIELSGWKGSVTRGLGADISLPPCLATGIWSLTHKSDLQAEISGSIVWYDALAPRPEVLLLWHFVGACAATLELKSHIRGENIHIGLTKCNTRWCHLLGRVSSTSSRGAAHLLFTLRMRSFARTESRTICIGKNIHVGSTKLDWAFVRARGPFLESPKTFRAHFGWHNSISVVSKRETFSSFNSLSLYNTEMSSSLEQASRSRARKVFGTFE